MKSCLSRPGTAAVVAMLVASPAFAQTAPSRGWVDVNATSLGSSQDQQVYTSTLTLFEETASAAAVYPELGRGGGADLSVGVHLVRRLGVGLHWNNVEYEYPVGVAVRIPHPLLFDRFGEDAIEEQGLRRRDRIVNVQASYSPVASETWAVRIFGGPSYFKVSQEMVEDIRFTQLFSQLGENTVMITSTPRRDVERGAWGYNVGIDAAYFFLARVGVGGVVRFNRARVSVGDDPLTGSRVELVSGGATAGGGVRFRF